MGTFSGQLGRDVPVTPVPLAALHSLARWWWGLTGHLSLLVDLEAAFLVDMEAIIYAQWGKALLAFTMVLIPTGEAFTHTHVKFGVHLGLLICKGARGRGKKNHYMGFIPISGTRQFFQDHYNTFTKQKVRPRIIVGLDVRILLSWISHLTNHQIIITFQYMSAFIRAVYSFRSYRPKNGYHVPTGVWQWTSPTVVFTLSSAWWALTSQFSCIKIKRSSRT